MTALYASMALCASTFIFFIGIIFCGHRWWCGVLAVVAYPIIIASSGALILICWLWLWPSESVSVFGGHYGASAAARRPRRTTSPMMPACSAATSLQFAGNRSPREDCCGGAGSGGVEAGLSVIWAL
jgi:hypothetical protein